MRRLALVLLVVSSCKFPDPPPEPVDRGPPPKSEQQEAVEAMGFSDVTMTGFAPFECGKDSGMCESWTATNVAGKRVRGVVDCPWVKGCTVRIKGMVR